MSFFSTTEPGATAGDPTPAQPALPAVAVAAAATYPRLRAGLGGSELRRL